MLPFLNMRHYKEIFQNLRNYVDKMNKNELTVEEVLDEDEIVQDIKTNQNTQFIPFFSNEVIRKLIDYSTKMPIIDDIKKGHKFPFNATEILCSDNNDIIERFFNQIKICEDDDSDDEENEEEEEKEEEEKKEEEKKEEEKKEEEKKEEEKKEEEKKDVEKKDEEKKEEEKKDEEKKDVEKKDEEKKDEEKKDEEKKDEEKKDVEKKDEEKKDVEKKDEEKNEEKNEENPLSMINLLQNKIEEIEKNKKEKKYKIIYDNIDYFFSFLLSPSTDDNYVLIGYFSKIFNHLIQTKGQTMMLYMFNDHPEYLTGLINHLNRRGIGECVKNILLFNQDIQDLDSLKISFCGKIIKELNNTFNIDKYNWITDTLINSISNKDFFNLFMSNQDLLQLLFSILYKNLNNNNSSALLALLIKINENILSNFDKLVTANLIQENPMDIFSNMYSYNNYMEEDKVGTFNEKNNDNLKNNINNLFKSIKESKFNFLEDLNQFDNDELLTTFQTKQKKLGSKKLSQIEYFRTIIDIIINSNSNSFFQNEIEELIKIANDKKIFWNINDIFFKYEFNNIFQIYYLQIINSILNKDTPELLVKYFFNDSERKLIKLLIDHLMINDKFNFGFSRKTNNCLLPFEIKILNEINESQNEYIKELIKDDSDFKVINEVLVNQINCFFNQKLLEPNEYNIDYNIDNEEQEKKIVYSLVLEEEIDENINIFKVYKEGGDYKKLVNEKNERINKRKKSDNILELSAECNDQINEIPIENDYSDKNKEKENLNINDIKVEEILENINIEDEIKVKKEDNLKENINYYDSNYWIHSNISDEEMESIIKDL